MSIWRLKLASYPQADIQNLKDAIKSADDVMQTMASSIFTSLIKVNFIIFLILFFVCYGYWKIWFSYNFLFWNNTFVYYNF